MTWPSGLVDAIGDLLSLQTIAQGCEILYRIANRPHPLIALLRSSPDLTWPFIQDKMEEHWTTGVRFQRLSVDKDILLLLYDSDAQSLSRGPHAAFKRVL